jgi:hypothetical protein
MLNVLGLPGDEERLQEALVRQSHMAGKEGAASQVGDFIFHRKNRPINPHIVLAGDGLLPF